MSISFSIPSMNPSANFLPRSLSGPQKSQTLATAVFERLRSDIVRCELKPGSRLRVEELRASYQVGIGPIREALMRLTSEGLVVLEDHRGFRVAPVSKSELLDITFMRKELEAKALSLGVERGNDRWEAQIVATYHELSKKSRAEDNGSLDPEWDACHRAFHLALVSACGSEWLLYFRTMLFDRWDRYRRLCVKFTMQPRNVLEEHRMLKEAVLNRDSASAADLIQAHIEKSTQILLAAHERLFDVTPDLPGPPESLASLA